MGPCIKHDIRYICYERHQNAVGCLKLDSMDAIRAVHAKVAADECHVASEALIVMAQPYDNVNYLPIPLVVIPSCKSMPATTQIRFLQQILGVWDRFADQGRLGELQNADSDGQPQRRQAFRHIFSCIDIHYAAPGTSGSKIWAVVSLMCLIDSCCGVHNRTGGFDLKHICKRFRTLYISTKRSVFVSNPSNLHECLSITHFLCRSWETQ